MTRLNLIITVSVAFTLGAAVSAHAQTASPSNCGVESWSSAKMAYVTVPCVGGTEQQTGSQTTKASASSSNCGVESWSGAKMAYVTTPCPAGTTYENPAATQ